MIIRVEVRVDGKIKKVEEIEVSRNETSKVWDFLFRAKEMLSKMSVAELFA